MNEFANYSPKVLGRLRRKDWDSKEAYLRRVKKRLGQVEKELAIWICNPTIEGVRVTLDLEDEKELMLRIISVLEQEEKGGENGEVLCKDCHKQLNFHR